jgi:hypothetical protein
MNAKMKEENTYIEEEYVDVGGDFGAIIEVFTPSFR